MRPVIERVMPSVEGAPDRAAATEENVRRAIEELTDACPETRALVESGRAEVAGGVYDLKTGVVRWLDV
jgi:carbonic anhydrase